MAWWDSFRRNGLVAEQARNIIHPPTISFDGGDPSSIPAGASFDRFEALQLPGVAKSHHVLVSWASSLNLRAYNEADIDQAALDPTFTPQPVDDQPTFLTDRTGNFSPEMRLWRMMDDLYFYGRHLWYSKARAGIRAAASPVPIGQWELACDDTTGLYSASLESGSPVTRQNSVLFKIPGWDGLLRQASRTLTGARATERAWVERMLSPAQIVNFQMTADWEGEQEEIDEWLDSWRKRRYDGGQAVGATPYGLSMEVHSGALGEMDLFLTSRNVIRNDVASHSSLDGSVADGSGGADSLTYETEVGIRDGFYEFDSAFWLNVIISTLSQAPVTPVGVVVRPLYLPVGAPSILRESPDATRETKTTTTTTNQARRRR